MNKFFIIGIGGIVVIALIVLSMWMFGGKTPTNNAQNTQGVSFPAAGSANQTGTEVPITKTKNFLEDSSTIKDPINQGVYYLGYHPYEGIPDQTATDTPPYVIQYDSATEFFNIALYQEPIGTTRKNAEDYLLVHLGVSQAELCRLNYMVSVPNRVNAQFAGRNLGFSFCPGATKLPE